MGVYGKNSVGVTNSDAEDTYSDVEDTYSARKDRAFEAQITAYRPSYAG